MNAAHERGRKAAELELAPSLNPYPEHSCDFFDWHRGWLCETGARLCRLIGRAPAGRTGQRALVIPHPSMTAEQCELVCLREGLQLAHLGRARFALVQTSARPQTALRIALTPDFRRERRRFDRRPDPEAA